jgi:hypothetical protein
MPFEYSRDKVHWFHHCEINWIPVRKLVQYQPSDPILLEQFILFGVSFSCFPCSRFFLVPFNFSQFPRVVVETAVIFVRKIAE